MTDNTTQTVLQRKAHAQRQGKAGAGWSIPRALGRALSIAADALWGMPCVSRVVGDETLGVEQALDALAPDPLLVLLEHETGRCGLVALERDILAGLIDVQTLGRVTRMPFDRRPYTPTDAAMTAPLIDAALPRFASLLSSQPEMAHLRDYRFGALVEDVQAANLALEAGRYHMAAFEVSLAQDTRQGQVVFLFPEPVLQDASDDPFAPGKHEALLKLAPVRMQAVLARVHIPLDQAQALQPGDHLTLSTLNAASATLVLAGGHVVAQGKLGQMNGFRAIRITGRDAAMRISDGAERAMSSPVSQTADGRADAVTGLAAQGTIPAARRDAHDPDPTDLALITSADPQ